MVEGGSKILLDEGVGWTNKIWVGTIKNHFKLNNYSVKSDKKDKVLNSKRNYFPYHRIQEISN